MQPEQVGPTIGRSRSAEEPVAAGSELDRLRATCRRQSHVIGTLTNAVSTLRSGVAALKAENADLRAAHSRADAAARADMPARGQVDAGETLDVPLPLDVRAPAAARTVVTAFLRDRVSASVLADVRLLVSELVSNSVRHSRASAGGVLVLVQLTTTVVRLEVADAGRGGVIAPRPADLQGGGGFGLNLVQTLSERWGVERVATSGTRVWAQLPVTAPARDDVATARAARNGRPPTRGGRRRRQSADG